MNGIRRAVFDTSTMVSAALRVGSVPSQALLHAFGCSDLCESAATLAELEMVLKRKKFNRYLDSETRAAFLTLVRRNARFFEVTQPDMEAVNPACRDPKDNKFLALAQVAEADVIVTSDEDLLVLHPWRQIPILRPAEFLAGSARAWKKNVGG